MEGSFRMFALRIHSLYQIHLEILILVQWNKNIVSATPFSYNIRCTLVSRLQCVQLKKRVIEAAAIMISDHKGCCHKNKCGCDGHVVCLL